MLLIQIYFMDGAHLVRLKKITSACADDPK